MSVASFAAPVELHAALDDESRAWLADLRSRGAAHDNAVGRLHELLLRAARFEVARRRPTLPHLRGNELDDIALEAADDALMSVLARLDDFRGLSRFTTWVYKFGL
jgi:RNA polymerase sigma-70 factor, ECF subfamily